MSYISKEFVRPFATVLRAQGYCPTGIARRLGDYGECDTLPLLLPADKVAQFCADGAALLGDPDLGLHSALALPPGSLGVLEFGPQVAPTGRAAVEFVVQHFSLLRPVSRLRLENSHWPWRVTFTPPADGPPNWELAEHEVALVVRILRAAIGADFVAERATFTQRRSGSEREFEQFLGTSKVEFGQRSTSLVLGAAAVQRTPPKADAGLFAFLSARATRELEEVRIRVVPSFIREQLASMLGKQAPTLSRLAVKLRMSTRTLQRRLEQSDTNFHELLDAVRAEKATHLLDTTVLPIDEVSAQLGYSSPRAFLRAFRRWTSTTPTQWRRRGDVLRAPPAA
ncbi:MAG: AraC family transcriptional regulator ligand-binding domain-containing protein [Deltaproteobacteria bacterium]|nr:AraC family transcriptional regulator ligand-binding domain-containing protein [Deltaproteobacteria bacterium]